MTIIRMNTNNKRWRGCGEHEPLYPVVGMYIGAATIEKRMDVSWEIKNRTIIWHSNSAPEYIPIKKKNPTH